MSYVQEYLERISEEQLYEEYLRQCLKGARPYGCRKYFGISGDTEYIGTIQNGKWLTDLYEDADGCFWRGERVMIGKWIITLAEFARGHVEVEDPYEKHMGICSDWKKVRKKYGGVPPRWEWIRPENQEEGNGSQEDIAGNGSASEGIA